MKRGEREFRKKEESAMARMRKETGEWRKEGGLWRWKSREDRG